MFFFRYVSITSGESVMIYISWGNISNKKTLTFREVQAGTIFKANSSHLKMGPKKRDINDGWKTIWLPIIHPGKLTWNLNITHLKRKNISSKPSF